MRRIIKKLGGKYIISTIEKPVILNEKYKKFIDEYKKFVDEYKNYEKFKIF